MKARLALAFAMIAMLGGLRAQAALFTSSATYSDSVQNKYGVVSNRSKPGDAPNSGFVPPATYANAAKLNASITSATVEADTVADTGDITAMAAGAFGVTPMTSTNSVTTSLNYIQANFPSPPTIQSISGTWTESVTFNGVTGPSPGFASVAPGPTFPNGSFLPWYNVFQTGFFTGTTSIFLTGTYQVVGPVSTLTIPISIELQPQLPTSSTGLAILGTNSFGNGFTFALQSVGMQYDVVNPVIFNGEVDHLHFGATLQVGSSVSVIFAQQPLPEPSCCVLLGMALVGIRRGRR